MICVKKSAFSILVCVFSLSTTLFAAGGSSSDEPPSYDTVILEKSKIFATMDHGKMKSGDIEKLIAEVKLETGTSTLDWFYMGGRCVLYIGKAEQIYIPVVGIKILAKFAQMKAQEGNWPLALVVEGWGVRLEASDIWNCRVIEDKVIEGYNKFKANSKLGVDMWFQFHRGFPFLTSQDVWLTEKGKAFFAEHLQGHVSN